MEEVQIVQASFGEKLRNRVLVPMFLGAAAVVGAVIAHKTGILPDLPSFEIVNNPVFDPNIVNQ